MPPAHAASFRSMMNPITADATAPGSLMSPPLPTLLVVDDTPANLSLMAGLLHQEYRVKLANSGARALDLAQREPPDLVLLDVMMPKKSGFEVCQEIRSDPEMAGVRILMLTAKGRDTEVAKGLALGADAYMTKPFSTRELVDKVRSMLEQ